MNAYDILTALDAVEEQYVTEAKEAIRDTGQPSGRRGRTARRAALLAAALAACLALCAFAAYESGLFDPWFQQPSDEPAAVVRSAIEGQLQKDYTLALRIHEIRVDETETERMIGLYTGSELARSRGWTEDYLAEHFLAVWARYYVEYDHTKTFLPDGDIEQYFYLVEDAESGLWRVVDNGAAGGGA